MRYLITSLLTLILVAPFAWSRITLGPSDDTAGGGAGNIYVSHQWGGNESNWPTALDCLRVSGGGASAYYPCALVGDYANNTGRAFTGTIRVRKLACTPSADITAWGATGAMAWGVYQKTGFTGGAVGYSRTLVGGSLSFTNADEPGVTKTLTINEWTTVSDGLLEVGLVTDNADTTFPSGFHCTVYWIES